MAGINGFGRSSDYPIYLKNQTPNKNENADKQKTEIVYEGKRVQEEVYDRIRKK